MTHVLSNPFAIHNFWSLLSCPMVSHQVLESLQTNKAIISNAKNARIYSYNIHWWHSCYDIDQSFDKCLLTVVETINLFQKLGFVIHPDKSKFMPVKIVEYLGFTIDSKKMIIYISDQKNKKFMRNDASFQWNQN